MVESIRRRCQHSQPTSRIRTSKPRTGMKRSLLAFLGAFLMQQASSQNPDVNQRTIACSDSNPPLVGYDRLQDIANDQQDEFDRISAGEAPRPPYIFRLCPNTEFNTNGEPLNVLLDGVMFTCGPNLASTDNCVFTGGNEQVRFEDSTLEGYAVMTASFVGVTFTNFGGSSINAYATAGLTAMFVNCVWRDFNSNFVVKLGAEVGAPPGEMMRVQISGGSLVQNGQGGTYFSNDGGTIIFDDVRFENIRAISAISSSTGGVTMLDRVVFNGGDLDSFAFAAGGAAHTIVNSTVSGLTGVNDIFSARGEGTTLTMLNVMMVDNKLDTVSAFTGVRVMDSATATVWRSVFSGNTGVSFGFYSINGGTIEMIDVDIIGNTGIQGARTAVTAVESNSFLTLRHVIFTDNFVFTSQVFALKTGNADIVLSCFNSGGGDIIIFMSENSVYTDVDNFVSPTMDSTVCKDARDGRLTQENQNSGCYNQQDSNPCSFGCERFGRATECVQTMAPTTTPSAAPTGIPSLAPTITPMPTGIGGGIGNGSGNGNTNGAGNGNGNGGGGPTISPAPTSEADATKPSIPTVGGPASGPSFLNNPAYAPFFMNPAVAPFFADPAVSPTFDNPAYAPFFAHPAVAPFFLDPAVSPTFYNPAFAPAIAPALDNPAFAPAFIPSLFSTPTCDPALNSPTVDPASLPSYNGGGQEPKVPSYYRPVRSKRKGKAKSSKSKSKGKGGKGGKGGYKKGMKGMRPARPPVTWSHHQAIQQEGAHQQHHQHQHHHHPHYHNQGDQDTNNGIRHPILHYQPPNQQYQNPVEQFHAQIQQFQAPPLQQYPPLQEQHNHGGISSPHQHGETLYVRGFEEKRVEWGTDHGWNAHVQTDETFAAVRPHVATSSTRRHPRIRRRRNLKGVRQELAEAKVAKEKEEEVAKDARSEDGATNEEQAEGDKDHQRDSEVDMF